MMRFNTNKKLHDQLNELEESWKEQVQKFSDRIAVLDEIQAVVNKYKTDIAILENNLSSFNQNDQKKIKQGSQELKELEIYMDILSRSPRPNYRSSS